MPYIPEERRTALADGKLPESVGELTYVLYKACTEYLYVKPKFSDFAEVLGALEATKLELYRRRIAPYEDDKLIENGDI